MSDEIDEITREFIVETNESLDEVDRQLVTLEQHATPDSLASIFRAIHTVKGTSGFLGFGKLESITHVGENLLSKLRDGVLAVDQDITTALLAMVDAVREIMAAIEATGAEGDEAYEALVAELERLERGEQAVEETADTVETVETADTVEATDTTETTETVEPVAVEQVEPAVAAPSAAPEATGVQEDRSVAAESIRVDVGLLDDLMNLVGELVLARNQILQYTDTQHDSTFTATTQRLNLITTELQAGVMRTRMQPIENVWNKFPRVVRDLSLACGKQAQLVMEGKHTELDKTLLEAIKDPLTHLVRNSVDHGLESPEGRAAAGKPAEGTVRLRSYHEGGQVIIEISDDGNGIDPAVIRRKAVEKGLMSLDEAAGRSDRDIVNVIFQPGFSTAAAVTNISGRGVGMDVVRTNIESIGGSVDVQSEVGAGTTFKVKIPLTLAIIPALVVTCDGDRFAIPQVSLLELVRIDGQDPHAAIETVHGVPVYRLRGRLLPIVHLHEVFGKPQPDYGDGINIVVLRADDREFGLVVDEISDTAEIVVKPLGRILKQMSVFAGATIMGDGRVALILDVLGIADHIEMATSGGGKQDDELGLGVAADVRRLLMCRVGERRLALMLESVARLEEFTADQIEVAAGRRVVQYRGEILDLVFVGEELGIASSWTDEMPLQAVVCTHGDRTVGVVVDDIYDIVEQALDATRESSDGGVLCSAVVQGKVIDVIDVEGILASAVPARVLQEALA